MSFFLKLYAFISRFFLSEAWIDKANVTSLKMPQTLAVVKPDCSAKLAIFAKP